MKCNWKGHIVRFSDDLGTKKIMENISRQNTYLGEKVKIVQDSDYKKAIKKGLRPPVDLRGWLMLMMMIIGFRASCE